MTEKNENVKNDVKIDRKLENLREYIKKLGSLAVAFSGGVDSTFLLKVAHETLGDRAIAVTAQSALYPRAETKEAEQFCKNEGIKQHIFFSDELKKDGFAENPPDRCYLCKKGLFGDIIKIAAENGIDNIAEGSNMDDLGDYRPGLKATAELGIKSPLREAELYKDEIRILSKRMGLQTWDKPAFACLASRFVYGQKITEEKLGMIEESEQFLRDRGFRQVRVRIHDNLARIELLPEDFSQFNDEAMRKEVHEYLRSIGFSYVTIDVLGYRTGSMNEVL